MITKLILGLASCLIRVTIFAVKFDQINDLQLHFRISNLNFPFSFTLKELLGITCAVCVHVKIKYNKSSDKYTYSLFNWFSQSRNPFSISLLTYDIYQVKYSIGKQNKTKKNNFAPTQDSSSCCWSMITSCCFLIFRVNFLLSTTFYIILLCFVLIIFIWIYHLSWSRKRTLYF